MPPGRSSGARSFTVRSRGTSTDPGAVPPASWRRSRRAADHRSSSHVCSAATRTVADDGGNGNVCASTDPNSSGRDRASARDEQHQLDVGRRVAGDRGERVEDAWSAWCRAAGSTRHRFTPTRGGSCHDLPVALDGQLGGALPRVGGGATASGLDTRRRSSASSSRDASPPAIASGSCGSTATPAPSATSSAVAVPVEVTTGHPSAIDSRTGSPNPSNRLG